MTYKEEVMISDMVNLTVEEIKNIAKLYGNDSVKLREKVEYLKAIMDVLDNLRELNHTQQV